MGERKSHLIELLEVIQDKQSWIWSLMEDNQRNQAGTVDDWAPKDHLAHATFWTEHVSTQLQIASGARGHESLDAFKQSNEETFERFKDQSWQEIQLWSEQVHGQLIDGLQAIPLSDLEDPVRFEWTNKRPLWSQVVFSAVYHRVQHACDILNLCGKGEYVVGFQEQFARMIEEMDDSDEWRGTTKYNLACYYALDGNPAAALETLREALKFNPSLLEWSKQDRDLDSLRELPEFQALYQGVN
jgi:tetratricopeptide (TPR) repeat protein